MYSNDQKQIRSGLVNYIGALFRSEKFSGRAGKQHVVGMLTEESMTIAKQDDGMVDYYIVKPILRATILIVKQRIMEMEATNSKALAVAIANYKECEATLEKMLQQID